MCNTNTTQAPQEQQSQQSQLPMDKDIQLANLQLQIVQTRSNAEYSRSVAAQMLREFEAMQRVAKPYAESTIVPTTYRGNIGNCVIALDMAHRMQLPALMIMQNLYVVNGNPSWSSKFLVACINASGRFTTIQYRKTNLGKLGKVKYNALEYSKEKGRQTTVVKEFDATGLDNWECVAYATEKSTGLVLESDPVTIEMAIKEGWYTKSGSKWVTMPMLMLSYRAAAFWQRTHAPEIAMGFRTVEEEQDAMPPVDVDYEDLSADNNAPDQAPADKPAQAAANATPKSANVEDAKARLRQQRANAANTVNNALFDLPS
jgi:hypothetical protein